MRLLQFGGEILTLFSLMTLYKPFSISLGSNRLELHEDF